MSPVQAADDPGAAAATIADLCAVLQAIGLAEERLRAAAARAGPAGLDARLASIDRSIDRIEARVGELETEVALFQVIV